MTAGFEFFYRNWSLLFCNIGSSKLISTFSCLAQAWPTHNTFATKLAPMRGSSFGGYIANINSAAYDIPCLLFNPALKYREMEEGLQEPFDPNTKSLSYIVLGRQDEVIKCDEI